MLLDAPRSIENGGGSFKRGGGRGWGSRVQGSKGTGREEGVSLVQGLDPCTLEPLYPCTLCSSLCFGVIEVYDVADLHRDSVVNDLPGGDSWSFGIVGSWRCAGCS